MSISANRQTTDQRRYGGVSAAQRKAERRDKFLQAGLQIFGTQGYRAGTVRVLCKQAGLTDRYFYESFTDTEDLLKQVYQHTQQRLQAALLAETEQPASTGEQRVRQALEAYFSAMEDPLVARITLTEVLGVSAAVEAMYQANTQYFGLFIMQQFQAEITDLDIGDDENQALGFVLAGACAMAAAQWLFEDYKTPKHTMINACATVLLGTLHELAGRGATSSAGIA